MAKLLRALYGHPRAGDLWHAKLDAILTKLGFEKHEAWPSVYILKASIAKREMCVIVVYVGDFLITGTPVVQSVIQQLKKQAVMDEPTPISKYPGGCDGTSLIGSVETMYIFSNISSKRFYYRKTS